MPPGRAERRGAPQATPRAGAAQGIVAVPGGLGPMTARAAPPGALTPRQTRAFAALAAYLHAHGYAPSQRELRDALGLASTRSVSAYLARLRDAGLIQVAPGVARGISLTSAGLRATLGP